MLHTDLPQPLGCSVVQQFEPNDGLELVKLGTQTEAKSHLLTVYGVFLQHLRGSYLSRSNLDVKVVAFV